MKLKKRIRNQKGILVSDALVAILIILLFGGIIIATIRNIVVESAKIKVDSMEMDMATVIFEHAKKISYEGVNTENLIEFINNKYSEYVDAAETMDELTDSIKLYKIAVNVEKYQDIADTEVDYDIMKIITLEILTKVKEKKYSTTIKTVKKASDSEVVEALQENT